MLVLGGIPPAQNLHEQPPNPSYAELYDPVTRAFSPIAGLTISHERYTATEVQLLDSGSGLLSPTGALGNARVGHTATLLQDGSVLVTGGTDARGNAIATAELYK